MSIPLTDWRRCQMVHKRKNDDYGVEYSDLFMVDRYFAENGEWYYYARSMGGEPAFILGPFLTKQAAINDCEQRFINPMPFTF